MEETPTIGRIVHVHGTDGEVVPAIVTLVEGRDRLCCTGFYADGRTRPFDFSEGSADNEAGYAWRWPERTTDRATAGAGAG